MRRGHRLEVLALLSLALPMVAVMASSCGDDSSSSSPKEELIVPDAGDDTTTGEDLCGVALISAAIGATDQIADAEVQTSPVGAGFETRVELPWPGDEAPWVYVRLLEGTAVPLSDVEAVESPLWDLAFKGSVVRSNGGISGPGGVEVAVLNGVDFADVSRETDLGQSATDALSAECGPEADAASFLVTAVGAWWTDGSGPDAPVPGSAIYAVRRVDGELAKVRFTGFEDLGARARITFEWASLSSGPTCDVAGTARDALGPVGTVSNGAVSVSTAAGVTTADVDASAGGFSLAYLRPFVYIDLDQGAKVDVSDEAAFDETTWDIAFKRAAVRVNGGDSGPGTVRVAEVDAAALDEVSATPPSGDFATDDFVTDECEIVTDALGAPATAMGEWYTYDVNGHGVSPRAVVYVIETTEGAMLRFRVATYSDGDYSVEWSSLP